MCHGSCIIIYLEKDQSYGLNNGNTMKNLMDGEHINEQIKIILEMDGRKRLWV
jgi:hypothetical protein